MYCSTVVWSFEDHKTKWTGLANCWIGTILSITKVSIQPKWIQKLPVYFYKGNISKVNHKKPLSKCPNVEKWFTLRSYLLWVPLSLFLSLYPKFITLLWMFESIWDDGDALGVQNEYSFSVFTFAGINRLCFASCDSCCFWPLDHILYQQHQQQ